MKIGPKEKLIIVAAGAVLSVVVLVAVLVWPAFATLGRLQAEVAVAQQDASQAQVLLEQRRAVKDRAASTDVALLQLANAFPENPELPSLIIELQDLAYENDVLLRSVSTQPVSKPAGVSYVEMPLELTVWGDWQETVDFLQDLPKLSRFIRIAEVSSRWIPQAELSEYPAAEDLEDQAPETKIIVKAYVIQPGAGAPPAAEPATTTAQ